MAPRGAKRATRGPRNGPLGPSWGLLGALLGSSWVFLGHSWGLHGAFMGPFGPISGPYRNKRFPSTRRPNMPQDSTKMAPGWPLGALLGPLGALLGPLRAIFGPSWKLLSRRWLHRGPKMAPRWPQGALRGPSGGPSWALTPIDPRSSRGRVWHFWASRRGETLIFAWPQDGPKRPEEDHLERHLGASHRSNRGMGTIRGASFGGHGPRAATRAINQFKKKDSL